MNEQEPTKSSPPVAPVVYYLQPQEAAAQDEISLLDVCQVLVSYKWLILGVTLVTTSVAVGIALWLPPIYRAEVTLAPVSVEEGGRLSAVAGDLGGLASLAGINLPSGGNTADRNIAVLNSRELTDAFINDEHLLPVLFSDIWDAQHKTWNVTDPKDTPTLRKAYEFFDKNIRTVTQDKKTGLVTLSIEWKDPKEAARWANMLVERTNRHEQKNAINEAEKSITYLNKQLASTSVVEMRQSIFRLIENQTKNIMLAKVRDQFAFRVIDPAVVSEHRAKPNRKIIVTLAFVLGITGGVLLALLMSSISKQRTKSIS